MTREPSTAWAVLLALLEEHPDAELNAVDEQGLFVPLPAPLAALGRPERIARSGIELVATEDHDVVIGAWVSLLGTGESSAVVRDADAPDRRRHLHLLDLRAGFGVVAALAWPADGGPAADTAVASGAAALRPRLGRTRKDRLSVFVDLEPDAEQLLGHPAGALLGTASRELVHPDDQETAISSWLDLLAVPGSSQRSRLRLRRGDGSWLWVDIINHNRLDDPGQACVVSDLVDVSDEMALREDVRARERLLQRLTQALPVGLLQVSATGEVAYTNDRLHDLLGRPRAQTLSAQLGSLLPADRIRALEAVRAALGSRSDLDLQVALDTGDGRRLCVLALRPLTDAAGRVEGVLCCVTDVTESALLRAELEQRATYDALTGCLNRSSVLHRLDEQLRAVVPRAGCAVLFFDLDGFKGVNDTLGHAAGDALLCEVAAALHAAVRSGDAVGRLGGDEFVVTCPDVPTHEAALALGRQVRARLDAGGLRVTASTGVAWSDDPALPAGTLLARADAAMYDAKRSGRTVRLHAVAGG